MGRASKHVLLPDSLPHPLAHRRRRFPSLHLPRRHDRHRIGLRSFPIHGRLRISPRIHAREKTKEADAPHSHSTIFLSSIHVCHYLPSDHCNFPRWKARVE